jgi:hypothetical protein
MAEHPAYLTDVEKPHVVEKTDWRTFPERHPGILFFLIVLLVLPLGIAGAKPLWHDELFTFYIAQAPNLSTLLQQTRTMDLNPPLSYLFVRALFHLLPASAIVCRIPSMAGFVLCMWCAYSFVGRKLNTAWGVVAALFLATGPAYGFAFEARPYGLMMGFVALAFIGWQRATDPKSESRLGLLLLVVGGFGALLSHVFAIFPWTILILAELVRVRTSRRVNWQVLLALLFTLIAVVTYLPLIRTHAVSYFPAAFQPHLIDILVFCAIIFRQREVALMWVTIFTLIFLEKGWFQSKEPLPLSKAESAALMGFLLIPVILIVYLIHSHGAFFPRYGIVAIFAVATLIPLFAGWLNRASRSVAWLTALVLILGSSLPAGVAMLWSQPSLLSLSIRRPPACEACALADRLAPSLPFVDASGLTYVEMDNREDAGFLSRVYYLTDPSASLHYAHATIFEGMKAEKEAFALRANVDQYSIFIRQHPTFLVFGTYDYPEDWLLRKLQADGAHLCLLRTLTDKQFKDRQLWQVAFGDDTNRNWVSPCQASV